MENTLLIVALSLAITLGLITLVFAAFAWGEGRRTARELARTNLQIESVLQQVEHDRLEAQQKVRQLENQLEEERLEQERQQLMEELQRWHKRYVESQQEVGRLEQERSEAQQKVEQLTRLRERLLTEMRELDRE